MLEGDTPRPAARGWTVTVDPELAEKRKTFYVPGDGIFTFVLSVVTRGADDLILSDGRVHLRVRRLRRRGRT